MMIIVVYMVFSHPVDKCRQIPKAMVKVFLGKMVPVNYSELILSKCKCKTNCAKNVFFNICSGQHARMSV